MTEENNAAERQAAWMTEEAARTLAERQAAWMAKEAACKKWRHRRRRAKGPV